MTGEALDQSVDPATVPQLGDGQLIECLAYYLESDEAAGYGEDQGNGFRSGLEAVLGLTQAPELEDLTDEQIAERAVFLTELRARVMRKFGSEPRNG